MGCIPKKNRRNGLVSKAYRDRAWRQKCEGGRDLQEILDCGYELVGLVCRERVERVAKTCLPEDFECRAPAPGVHVELNAVLRACAHSLRDSIASL